MISAAQLQEQTGGQLLGPHTATFASFSYDTRRMLSLQPTCFVALPTAHADGHEFAAQAVLKGATVLLVDHPVKLPAHKASGVAQIVVPDTLEALLTWASHSRDRFTGAVVAITGSNGKTVVKEWAYQLLGSPPSIYRTPGSFNSRLGVALTLSGLYPTDRAPLYRAAIVEVGIDRAGTMSAHRALVQPNYGVFTHLGAAHDEGFEDLDEKFAEKWSLIEQCERIVCARRWYDRAAKLDLPLPSALLWGQGEALDPEQFAPNLSGHHLENAMNAVGIALLLGGSRAEVQQRMDLLRPLEMRMQLTAARGGGHLLEDTYSSDLDSLHLALQELLQQPSERKMAVLSELESAQATAEAKQWVASLQLSRTWWLRTPEELPQVLASIQATGLENSVLLIKGQRRFQMERIAAALREQMHSTWAEINLGAMRRNLQQFRALVKPTTKVMAMVKASSYGSGTVEIAQWLQKLGIDYLGVAFAQEALNLRAQGVRVPMLVMNAESDQLHFLASAECEVELYALHQLEHWKKLGTDHQWVLKVHLKIETGMHRLGMTPEDLPEVLDTLQALHNVEVTGVFSHLSSADDDRQKDYTLEQLSTFAAAAALVRERYPLAIAHVLNTHGIARYAEYQFDMVRLGLGLYGVGHYPGVAALEEVLQWKCRISQVSPLSKGQSLGYGRSFQAEKPMTYATVPVGYADGLLRSLSREKGALYLGEHRCAILGNICMDMTMVDTTGTAARPGDELVILGPAQSAAALAADAGTIPYEILTRIGPRVPRVYIKD